MCKIQYLASTVFPVLMYIMDNDNDDPRPPARLHSNFLMKKMKSTNIVAWLIYDSYSGTAVYIPSDPPHKLTIVSIYLYRANVHLPAPRKE